MTAARADLHTFPLNLLAAGFALSAFFVPWHGAAAATTGTLAPNVRVFDAAGDIQASWMAYSSSFRGGVNVALADTNADGTLETITAAGAGGGPEVKVFSAAGAVLHHFFAYDKRFRGGVRVAAYDLDGDNRAEIITAPGLGGGPEIKVFSSDGTFIRHFFAYDKAFRGGVNLAVGPFGHAGQPLIATASGYGSGHVRLFGASGSFAGISFFPFGKITYGLTLAAVPDGQGRALLAIGPERTAGSTVKVFDVYETSTPTASFRAFGPSFKGGVHLAGGDINADGTGEIVVGAGAGGGPHVAIFSLGGTSLSGFMAYPTNFRGGISVAAGLSKIATGPSATFLDGRPDLHKYIQIDLSDQTLKFFQDGRLLGTHRVSTGKWSTPTPIGTHAIKNKITLAYSKPYDLYMEWWMAFTPDGGYGLHALPFWKLANGGRKYEGLGHLGTPVSHGCIRQSLVEAKALFRWADIGTTVIVKR